MSTAAIFALTYLVHSTLLLGAVWSLHLWGVRRPAWREVLWKTALFGPLLTTTIAVAWPALRATPPISLAALAPAIETATPFADGPSRAEPTLPSATKSSHASRPQGRAATSVRGRDRAERTNVPPGLPSESSGGSMLKSANVPAPFSFDWVDVALTVWLAVAVLLLVRLAYQHWRLHRALRRRKEVVDPSLLASVAELRRTAGVWRPVRLTSSSSIGTPVALGASEICVPDRFLSDLAADRQRAALAHELGHLARRDPSWQLATAVIERLFFFQPLNRVARQRLREIAEFMADGWAARHLGSPLALAQCLADVASWISPPEEPTMTETMAMAEGGSPLLQRVRRLLEMPPETLPRGASRGFVALALIALPAGFAPGFTTETVESDTGARPLLASATVPSLTAASAAMPRATTKVCAWPDQDGRHSVHAEIEEEHVSIRITAGDCALVVRAKGLVQFDDGDSTIASLGVDSWFELEERSGSARRRVTFERLNGKLDKRWYENGRQTKWSPVAARWLKDALLVMFRRSSYGAPERSARLYAKGGVSMVLDEAAQTRSPGALRHLLLYVIEQDKKLSEATIQRIAKTARRIRSPSARAAVLVALIRRTSDPRSRATIVAAAADISSPSSRAQVLLAVTDAGAMTPALAEAIIAAVPGMSSPSAMGRVLRAVGAKLAPEHALPQSYVDVAARISSPSELSRVLIASVERQTVGSDLLQSVLEVAPRISSPSAQGRVLRAVASRHRLGPSLVRSWLENVRSLSSPSEQERTLLTLVNHQSDANTLMAVARSTRAISSPSSATRVLVNVVRHADGNASVLREVLLAVDSVSSPSDRERVIRAAAEGR